MLAAS